MKASDQIKRAALMKTMDYLLEDPEGNVTKIMDMLDKVAPADLFPSQRKAFRTAIDTQNNWYQLIMKVLELNPLVRDRLIKNFVVDCNLMAWPQQEKMREEHRCNIPWAI
ncbi:MAG: radical SAM protein, partial [Coriobacteriales bacterium]